MESGDGAVVVAEASIADAAAFARFFRRAWEESGPDAPGFVGATDAVIDELTTREAIVARMGGPERRMYLAWIDGDVVGFAATRRVDEVEVELAGVVVLSGVAGRGIGTQLVELAVASALSEGYERMFVHTEVANDRALSLYERLGFTRTAVISEEVDGSDVEVWELERDL